MSEIINLRQARKAKRRVEAVQTATENRAKHGRTKADKKQEKMEQDRAARAMEGHALSDASGSVLPDDSKN